MKQLEKEFIGIGEVKGFKFKQLLSSENGYLYEVTIEQTKHYEVFKHKVNNKFNCVSYPKSKSFGIWAWCITDYNKALNKFNSL